jgi:hypothetical protein
MEKQKGSTKEARKNAREETSEDFLSNAKYMLASSVGRLPTALVVILLVSVAMATVTGLVMQLNRPAAGSHEFMPQRLEITDDAPQVDVRKLQGNWVYQTLDYAMTLTFIGDRFEWIVSFKDIPEAQFFARGNFRTVGDVMILGVRPDLGKPVDPSKPWMKYMPIAMKDMNTKFSFPNKAIIWDVPTSEQSKILAQSGRIFTGHEDGHFEWTKQQ